MKVTWGEEKAIKGPAEGFRALVSPQHLRQLLEGASALLPLSVFNLLPLVFISGPI